MNYFFLNISKEKTYFKRHGNDGKIYNYKKGLCYEGEMQTIMTKNEEIIYQAC